MSRKSAPIELTIPEIKRLEQWIRAGSTPQQVVLRCRIALHAAAGREDVQISAEFGINRRTVALWRKRVITQGMGSVWDIASGRGRKPTHGPEKIAAVITATLQQRPTGSTHWSTRSLARAQGLGKSSVHRIWQDQDLRPTSSAPSNFRETPNFWRSSRMWSAST